MPSGKLVIFDWDGTLANSIEIIIASIQAAGESIGREIPRENAAHIIGLGLVDATKTLLPDVDDEKILNAFSDSYRENYKMNEEKVKLFDGALSLLDHLRAEDFTIAIATGKSRRGLNRALEILDVAHYFSASRTSDETNPKPAPDMILEIAEMTKFSPESATVIGDTTHDMKMARSAGARAVAVTHGAHPAEKLKTTFPDFMFDDLHAVYNFFMQSSF